jgi:CheY-like chemotaxis protein
MPAKRILVVDDDRQVRDDVGRILGEGGYAVHAVASGQEGLDALPKFKPDLIILDIQLPGMSGIEFINRIADPGGTSLSHPVLLLTMHPNLAAFLAEYVNDLSIKVADDSASRLAGWLGLARPTADRQELLHKVNAILFPPGPRVLVGEPDEGLYVILRRVLTEDGCAVDRVEDGEMLLARALETKPDVIVANSILPHMNGDVVARKLKEFNATASIPVHLYESSDLPDDRRFADLVDAVQAALRGAGA